MENGNLPQKHSRHKSQIRTLLPKRCRRKNAIIQLDINEADKAKRINAGNTRFGGDSRVKYFLCSFHQTRRSISKPLDLNIIQAIVHRFPTILSTAYMPDEQSKDLIL